MLGFRGLGYDEAFVENMAGVVAGLRAQPQTILLLTDSSDDLCAACPYDSDQGCSREKDGRGATERDRATLQLLGLRRGTETTVASVYALVSERLTAETISEQICVGCDWLGYGYCADGLTRLKASGEPGIPL